MTHEHITCTLDAGGDAPQLTSKDSHRKRDSQDDRRELLKTRNPAHPGGTPSGSTAAMGCSRSIRSPLEPRGSLPFNEERTKNEKEITRKRDKSRVKRCRLICSIVCCSIGRHLSSIYEAVGLPVQATDSTFHPWRRTPTELGLPIQTGLSNGSAKNSRQ